MGGGGMGCACVHVLHGAYAYTTVAQVSPRHAHSPESVHCDLLYRYPYLDKAYDSTALVCCEQ